MTESAMNFEIIGKITNIETIAVGSNIRILPLWTMEKYKNVKSQFAICIHTDDPDLLTLLKIYQILPDESAQKSNYIRVIDNEGEDYLYPADYFIFTEFPSEVKQVLLNISDNDIHKEMTNLSKAWKLPLTTL